MMVTAVLALTLAAASVPPVQVRGDALCPAVSEVAALLPEMLPSGSVSYPDIAWIEASGLELQIQLRSLAGEMLFSRRLTSSGTCADLANIAAVIIASWTAERNPGISLLQPGVPAPPKPVAPPAPSAPIGQGNGADPAPAAPTRTREFDLSIGLGSSVNRNGFVGAARVETGLRGRRWGLRAGLAAETERNESFEARSVSWRRYAVSLGPTLAVVQRPLILDARAEVFAGFTTVAGHGFDIDRESSAVAPGLALSLRLGTATRWIRPWIEVGGQYWLANQQIAIARDQQPDRRVSLPSSEVRLLGGVSFVLSR